MNMRYNKEILNKIKHKNATVVGASIARQSAKARTHKRIIFITLPILFLLIVAVIIGITMTNAANNATEPETEQTFTEEGDGYYIWVRAVDHAGNKGPWSEAQRVWIETGLPTITIKTNSNTTWAQTGSVTVALQDSKSGLAEGASVKYGWSTSLDTAPDSYTDASLNYTVGTKEEVTFTASASGLTGKYYLWVVPTTLADTAGNSQTATVKSTGQFYFDNTGPSAPTITGGNTTYNAASLTIKVSTAATDEHIGTVSYYEYYKASDSTAPTASTNGTKVTTSDNSVTFASNIAGDYVYFRGVDSLGNKGTWSSAQRLYIDINDPTVSYKNASVTIKKGDNVAMSTYFTTGANGNAAISSTVYKIGSTSYTNTSELAVGTYTVTCTVTKVTGKSAQASMTLVVNAIPSTDTLLVANNEEIGRHVYKYCTIPEGVTMLKIVTSGGDLSPVVVYDKHTQNNPNKWVSLGYGPSTSTNYISVTPGMQVTFYSYSDGEDVRYCAKFWVYYSSEINKQQATKSWERWD